MKIAVLYPESRHAAWSVSGGLVSTLRRMGHSVIEGSIPVERQKVSQPQMEAIRAGLPPVEALQGQDLILLSGPEHIAPWLDLLYSKYLWKQIAVPKAGWYHESFYREDYTIDFEAVEMWSDEHFFPAVQDAEFHDQEPFAKGRSHCLPFGVDTQMFAPLTQENWLKEWPIAFVGAMYERRQKFLNALAQHHFPNIRIGSVGIEDLSGWCAKESTRRLADNYRRIGVFFNLPAMSGLLVTKVYEVMACGTFLLTPQLPPDRGTSRNMEPFENGKHLIYYRSSNLPYIAQLLRDWSSEEKRAEREAIAAAGCAEVHAKHSLEQRLEVIQAKCGAKVSVQ